MESQVASIEAGANGADALQALDKLEGRIQGAIERYRTAQRERSEAEKEAALVKSLFAEKDSEIERLRAQAGELRLERDEVRSRIEALLEKIEALAE